MFFKEVKQIFYHFNLYYTARLNFELGNFQATAAWLIRNSKFSIERVHHQVQSETGFVVEKERKKERKKEVALEIKHTQTQMGKEHGISANNLLDIL